VKAIREYVKEIEYMLRKNSEKDRDAERMEQKDNNEALKAIEDLNSRLSQRIDEMEEKIEDEGAKNDFDFKKLNKRLTVSKGKTGVNTEQIARLQEQMQLMSDALTKLQTEVNGEAEGGDYEDSEEE
jgi:hypothetical protein